MAELLLEKNLRTSTDDEVRNVARARTLTILPHLDPKRRRSIFQFLSEFVTTPYRIVCNGTEQKSSEARAGLSLAPSRCIPLHKIRYGIKQTE